ncbi:MAG: hypothetical protein IJ740_08230 [Ruminococcus sp.]|nr:hypothetical protein [Ruminococcus sp.]
MDKNLYFGGERMPTPVKVTYGVEKIWSKNTGRSGGGVMVGDIIALKRTYHVEWAHLSPEEIDTINAYISNISNAFFTISALVENFGRKAATVYAGPPTYEPWGWDEDKQLCKLLAVDLIEQ